MTGESGDNVAVDTQPTDDYVMYSETVAETAAEEQTEEVTPSEENQETESEEQDQNGSEGPKRKGGWQRKIDRLSNTNTELQTQLAEKEAELAKLRSGPAKSAEAPNGKPDASNYETYDEYQEALTDWKIDQREAERVKKDQEIKVRSEVENKAKSFQQKAIEFSKEATDYDAKINEYFESGYVTQDLQDAVIETQNPAVAYYLATNPDEAMALDGLDSKALYRAIGRIEAKLENSVKAAVKTTRAPQPITPVNRSSTNVTKDPDKMDMDEYTKWREQSLRR